MRLLLVEDEIKVASFIQKGLQQEHYAVDIVHDGAAGLELAERGHYDLIILDLMLPGMSGLEILARLREKKHSPPILVLTAKAGIDDRVQGLDRGADDYMVKPFAFAELSARVRALLRRETGEPTVFSIADLRVDIPGQVVTRAGRRIDLSSKEFALLEYLIRSARRPVTRTMIIEHVWDIHFDSVTNVVEVYINYLRNKVDKGFSPALIHTVRGVGYMLTDQP
jgi:heavy metal response regulator